jgi:hypothetical protein
MSRVARLRSRPDPSLPLPDAVEEEAAKPTHEPEKNALAGGGGAADSALIPAHK